MIKIKLKCLNKKYALIIYSFFIKCKLKCMGYTELISLSINSKDIYTNVLITKIPFSYVYCLQDFGEIYTFDIRTLKLINPFINPYTGNVLNEMVYQDMIKKTVFLNRLGFPLSFTPECIIKKPCYNDIIYNLHMLDFDIKKKWFIDISVNKIKKILLECYSKYSHLSHNLRYNIDRDRSIFRDFPTKKSLQKYLSDIIDDTEYIDLLFTLLDKFSTSGKNKEYKKIGAMYFLQAVIKHAASPDISDAFFYLQ